MAIIPSTTPTMILPNTQTRVSKDTETVRRSRFGQYVSPQELDEDQGIQAQVQAIKTAETPLPQSTARTEDTDNELSFINTVVLCSEILTAGSFVLLILSLAIILIQKIVRK